MKLIKYLSFLFLFMIAFNISTFAQHEDITGLWKTIDDETGRVKSVVKIYLKDGKLFGDVVKLFRLPDEDQDPTCSKCDEDDPRKDQKIIGMTINCANLSPFLIFISSFPKLTTTTFISPL